MNASGFGSDLVRVPANTECRGIQHSPRPSAILVASSLPLGLAQLVEFVKLRPPYKEGTVQGSSSHLTILSLLFLDHYVINSTHTKLVLLVCRRKSIIILPPSFSLTYHQRYGYQYSGLLHGLQTCLTHN